MADNDREAEIRARLGDIIGEAPGDAERALVTRLLRSFAGKTPPGVDRLAELLRGGDPDELRDHAHLLKGSAANIGAGTLARVLAEVEHAAREGSVPDPELTLGRVTAELALVLGIITSLAEEFDPAR